MEGVLLDLSVAEGLQDSTSICAKEVVRHIGVEVQVVCVIKEVPGHSFTHLDPYLLLLPFLGCMFELLVVVVYHTDPVRFTVSKVAGKVTTDSCPKEWRDPSGWGQMVLVDVIQYL